jgi:hypothetical protein
MTQGDDLLHVIPNSLEKCLIVDHRQHGHPSVRSENRQRIRVEEVPDGLATRDDQNHVRFRIPA